MPRKGMKTLSFFPRKAIISSSSSTSDSNILHNPRRIFADAVMDRSLMIAETMIMKWNPDTSTSAKVTSLFHENRREVREFIKCVNELQKSMHVLVMEDPNSKKLVRGQELMEIAMKRLQKEFYQILLMNRAHLDPESVSVRSSRLSTQSSMSDFDDEDDEIRVVGDSIAEVEDVSNTAMVDLRSIAECMILCGYGKECVSIYKLIRKSIIDEGIYKLGVQKMSSSHVHKMDWNAVELKIKNWLEAVKVAVKTLFNGERILCDHVFASSKGIMESCFADISREGAQILFGFPEIVAKSSKKAPEKLFRLLDMYAAISEKWPMIESIFSFEALTSIKSQVINSLIKIGEFVRAGITEFECAIQKDTSKTPATGGGIHPLTTRVINYLTLLADYHNVLADILAGYSPPSRSYLLESFFNASDSEEASPTSHLFAWLIFALLCKLDTKAKHYKDVSLAYLFLANNLQHIITKVQTSNIKFILGDDWTAKHKIKVKQFATNFERLAWDHVIKSLPEKPTPQMSTEEVAKWFLKLNTAFEQAHHKQSVCVIPDENLRDAIKASIAKKIVPMYRQFYNTHKVVLLGRKNFASMIKFSPEGVEKYLSDIYSMTTGSGATVSSSSTSSHSRVSLSQEAVVQ